MKYLVLIIAVFIFSFNQSISQSYIEGVDLPGTGVGPAFTVAGAAPSISIQGTLNTPYDGQDRFQIVVPYGCTITGVTYLITDTYNISVNGFTQFGTNNQMTIPPLTGSFTGGPSGPFPVVGPVTLDCMMSANIAANDTWFMVFFSNCSGCIDPDVPNLGPNQNACVGDILNLNVGAANLNDAIDWQWYIDSCGGTNIGTGDSISLSPTTTTTYYARGEGACVVPGICAATTIIITPVDTGVIQNGNILMANTNQAAYQWLDCNNNFAIIPGQTAQTFMATTSGSYGVLVTDANGCVDTSSCHSVLITGLEHNQTEDNIFIYPNPVKDAFQINLNSTGNVRIRMTDVQGRLVLSDEVENVYNSSLLKFEINQMEPGMYYLHVLDGMEIRTIRLIKQ